MRSCLLVTPGPNLIAWRKGIIRKEAFILRKDSIRTFSVYLQVVESLYAHSRFKSKFHQDPKTLHGIASKYSEGGLDEGGRGGGGVVQMSVSS